MGGSRFKERTEPLRVLTSRLRGFLASFWPCEESRLGHLDFLVVNVFRQVRGLFAQRFQLTDERNPRQAKRAEAAEKAKIPTGPASGSAGFIDPL